MGVRSPRKPIVYRHPECITSNPAYNIFRPYLHKTTHIVNMLIGLSWNKTRTLFALCVD